MLKIILLFLFLFIVFNLSKIQKELFINNKYYYPISIRDFYIYDILYNDNNELIIITPYELDNLNITYNNNIFLIIKCPHKHTIIYKLKTKYKKNINLIINNKIIKTNVNKYPKLNNLIIFSTIVKNENKYIKQWIDFHYNLGVNKFIIYDNSNNNSLIKLLNNYIINKKVILIKWIYPYRLKKSGISGQTTQQNHSLYTWKNSKYIGFFDIDEYVNIQNGNNLNIFLNKYISNNNLNIKNISCFQLSNKNFYNPYNKSTENLNFLYIYNCDKIIKKGREKNIVIPKNTDAISVHTITLGKHIHKINYKNIYFNHYIYLNKKNRGKKITNLKDNTIIKNLN